MPSIHVNIKDVFTVARFFNLLNQSFFNQSPKQTPEPEVTSLLNISEHTDWPDIDLLSDSAAKTDIVASALAASDVVLDEEMESGGGGKCDVLQASAALSSN